MHITVRCILAAGLLVSAHADCFNQGSQRFCERTPAVPQETQNYEAKEVLLYLTPNQVQILEAKGFVLRPEVNQPDQQYPIESEHEQGKDQDREEELNQGVEQEQSRNAEDQNIPQEVLQLEEVFRVLNKQISEDAKRIHRDFSGQESRAEEGQEGEDIYGEKKYDRRKQRVKYVEEKEQDNDDENQYEKFRNVIAKFGVLKRYRIPSDLTEQNQQQSNRRLRPLPSHQQLERWHQDDVQDVSNEEFDTRKVVNIKENKNILQDKRKVVVIVDEPSGKFLEENGQLVDLTAEDDATIELNNDKVQSIAEYRRKLKEIQFLTGTPVDQAPRQNNRKYSIAIERLRADLEQQKELEREEFVERFASVSNKEQIDSKNTEIDTNNKERLVSGLNDFESSTLRATYKYTPTQVTRSIPVPVIKRSRLELINPLPVGSETHVTVAVPKKVYSTVDNPYSERIDPVEFNKQFMSVRKPGPQTIIRHVWEH